MIKLITSNTKDDIMNLIEEVKSSFYLISPFIGINTSKILANIIKEKKIKATIITRFSRNDFFVGASSIEGLRILKEAGFELKAVKKLHTKLYVFDNNAIILGSSNFTDGGLISNIELNILIKDEKSIVNHGITYFDEININIDEEYFITEEMIQEEISFLKSLGKNEKPKFPKSTDFGKEMNPKRKLDKIEELLSPNKSIKSNNINAWIKFEGYSDHRRTKNNTPLNIALNNEDCYRTHFPKKPTGYKNGDLIFIARSSWDKNGDKTPIIYGYGITRKFTRKNVMTKEQQEANEVFKRWPYYIYVENFRFINTNLADGISLLDMLRDVGYNSYPGSSKRKSSFAKLKRIHGQRDKLRITDEAKDYLLTHLNKIL
ncbi:phospholipase D family protein [Thalassobellus citreus]|uniref:phospholipase D family protein n=1 Tax=Thalassobellus citreus TaxID=3367752 RepID=UPI0037BC5163